MLLFAPLELKLDPVTSAGARAERRYDDTAGADSKDPPRESGDSEEEGRRDEEKEEVEVAGSQGNR